MKSALYIIILFTTLSFCNNMNYDMADIDEFDPMFEAFKNMDMSNMGIA